MKTKTVASSLLLLSLTAGTAAFAATTPTKAAPVPTTSSSMAPASGDTKPAAKAPAKAKTHRWHRHTAAAKKTDTKKSGR